MDSRLRWNDKGDGVKPIISATIKIKTPLRIGLMAIIQTLIANPKTRHKVRTKNKFWFFESTKNKSHHQSRKKLANKTKNF